MDFTLTALNVIIMLAYAVPGFIFVKTKLIDQSHIASFSKVLLYVCQPCLSMYSFNQVDCTPGLLKNMALFFVLAFVLESVALTLLWLVFRRRYSNPVYRVCTVAGVLGNVGFFGVPLLEALLPEHPESIAYSAVFIVAMNIISWTVGSLILTGDRKYLSIRKLFLNPPTIALCISLPLFILGIKFPDIIDTGVTLLGRMSTPMCMLILGMRLATVRINDLLKDKGAYMASAVKLIVFPLVAYAAVYFLPLDYGFKATMFILASCPTASVVLNLSELYGRGQKTAADTVLICTMLCAVTIPLLLLIL